MPGDWQPCISGKDAMWYSYSARKSKTCPAFLYREIIITDIKYIAVVLSCCKTRSGAPHKLSFPLQRTLNYQCLLSYLMPGIGQNISASITVRNSAFLISSFSVGSLSFISPKPLHTFWLLCLGLWVRFFLFVIGWVSCPFPSASLPHPANTR